jgi:hypothetical protein
MVWVSPNQSDMQLADLAFQTYEVVEEVPDHHEGRLGPDDAGTVDVIWYTIENADYDLQSCE